MAVHSQRPEPHHGGLKPGSGYLERSKKGGNGIWECYVGFQSFMQLNHLEGGDPLWHFLDLGDSC